MRTTVDIPDPVYRQLKAKAALRGCSGKELILRGVESELGGLTVQRKGGLSFPFIKSRRPGWLKISNKTINDVILP